MSRLLIAWELGSGYGHLMKLGPLARALAALGHDVQIAVKDPGRARSLFDGDDLVIHPAPVLAARRPEMPLAVSYAEVLIRIGWLDTPALGAHLARWRRLLDDSGCDAVLLNNAPGAWLASRGLELGRVVFGTGFECPEFGAGSPVCAPWVPADRARLEGGEHRLLHSVNVALADNGQSPLQSLRELLACDGRFLLTYPELDPYAAQRPRARYHGALSGASNLAPAQWGDAPGRRVFAYLNRRTPGFDAVLRGLAAGGCQVLAHVPGLPDEVRARHEASGLRFSERPVDLSQVAGEARAAVCNGGHGTLGTFLAAGCPLLVIPSHVEQWINGTLAERAGLGLLSPRGAGADGIHRALDRLLSDARFRSRARRFARRHAIRHTGDRADVIAREMLNRIL